MGKSIDSETNQRILEAARRVFAEKGYAAARTQEIADVAKVNKGLLTYYKWNKQKLFLAVFEEALETFFGHLSKAIATEETQLMGRLEYIISKYIDMLLQNPMLPGFVLSEINQHPHALIKHIKSRKNFPDIARLLTQIHAAGQNGKINPVDPVQLMISIISMCVFPFAGKPLLQGMTNMDNATFYQLMQERKTAVISFVKQALTPTQTDAP